MFYLSFSLNELFSFTIILLIDLLGFSQCRFALLTVILDFHWSHLCWNLRRVLFTVAYFMLPSSFVHLYKFDRRFYFWTTQSCNLCTVHVWIMRFIHWVIFLHAPNHTPLHMKKQVLLYSSVCERWSTERPMLWHERCAVTMQPLLENSFSLFLLESVVKHTSRVSAPATNTVFPLK